MAKTNIPELSLHGRLREPELSFHPDRPSDRSPHPLSGLIKFGPYSRSLLNAVVDPIRVALVAPAGEANVLERLLAEAERAHQPRERVNYLPPFPGFSKVFGVRVVSAGALGRALLPHDVDAKLAGAEKPHLIVAEALTRALSGLAKVRHEYDVVAIYLPDRWARAFYGPEGDDFDLHDYLKATAAVLGLPTQVVREDKALTYPCRCSVMWRLGIALYTKAGGTPWRLPDVEAETAYVGISYALRQSAQPAEGRFVSCCSQVFDADGTGFEFLVYSTDSAILQGDNPYLSKHEMNRVMGRSLLLYQRRHAGRSPRRVVVHKTTEFRPDEVEGCFDAFHSAAALELVQIQQDSAWRGVQIEEARDGGGKGKPAAYPILRGSYLPIGPREVLLWTQGDAPEAVGGRHFYKEGKGVPSPLLLRRFAGHGGWEGCCREVLALTKMDWNNDALYDRLPVTIGYSQAVAQVMKRMDPVASGTYPFRLFM